MSKSARSCKSPGKYKDAEPFNGQHFEALGVTTDMMEDFAQRCGVNLIVLHGNTKIKHIDLGTDRYLCFHQWDNHCYLVKNARPYVQKPVIDLDKAPRHAKDMHGPR